MGEVEGRGDGGGEREVGLRGEREDGGGERKGGREGRRKVG